MELKTFIAALKYSGIILAGLSAIWGLTHELYIKDEKGKRNLTGPGKAALAITILSLLISLNTAALESVLKSRDEQRAQDDAKLSRLEQQQRDLAQQQRDEALAQQQRDEALAQQQRDEALSQQQRDEAQQQREKIDAATRNTLLDAAARERREISRLGEIVKKQEATIFDVNRNINPLTPIAFAVTVSYSTDDKFWAESYQRIKRYTERWLSENYPRTQTETFLVFGVGDVRHYENIDQIVLTNKTNTHFVSSNQPIPDQIGELAQNFFIRIKLFKNQSLISSLDSLPEPDITYDVYSYDIKDLESVATGARTANSLPENIITMTMVIFPKKHLVKLEIGSRAVIRRDNTGRIASVLDLPGSLLSIEFPIGILTSGEPDRRPKLEDFFIQVGPDYAQEIYFDGTTFRKGETKGGWPVYSYPIPSK